MPYNLIEEGVKGLGSWGGSCTCPDGSQYLVSDNGDGCSSLACVGGISGVCIRASGSADGWAKQRRVTCGQLPMPPLPPQVPPSPIPPPALPAPHLSVNEVLYNVSTIGVWGGTCTCPNGEQYLVGDEGNFCGSLACWGGVAGECHRSTGGGWAGTKVVCGTPIDGPPFKAILNPSEDRRHYSSEMGKSESGLHSDTGWIAEGNATTQSIILDLEYAIELTGVAIQKPAGAGASNFVTSFEVELQLTPAGEWKRVYSAWGGLVFLGPQDERIPSDQMIFSYFAETKYARMIRITPLTWQGATAGLRTGVLAKHKRSHQQIRGMTSEKCDMMLRDPTHLFRRMWAAEAWAKQQPDEPRCWDQSRDQHGEKDQTSDVFFNDILHGTMCESNWYEGNPGALGDAGAIPQFSRDAFALLGFDEGIDDYCRSRAPFGYKDFLHAERCVAANVNILSLYGQRVPYNICRNLEWQACAARGRLPGQRTAMMRFATSPVDLDPTGMESGKPLGKCRGWLPPERPSEGYGYATDDIFFLEVCLFNQMCSNGEEMFSLGIGEGFQCDFSIARFAELRRLLLEPPDRKSVV